MAQRQLASGDRISEYILEAKIGEGGFGQVWRAHHHIWKDRLVAVKVPQDADYVEQLQREGVLQHELEGEHVVKTVGLDPFHDPPYLIMDYIDGKNLRGLLEEKGSLPIETALNIATQVAEVLSVAHKKSVVHRDIKPENILVDREGVVWLTDFGLGKVAERLTTTLLRSGSLVTTQGRSIAGTLNYMSPEQRSGEDVDPRTDIYSLGLVLFELLTGKLPEGGEVPTDLRPGLPERVDAIFSRCYARREKRYPSVDNLLQDLVGLREKSKPRPLKRPISRVQPRSLRRGFGRPGLFRSVPPTFRPIPPRPGPPSPAAIASLVLGVLGLFSCGIFGIVALLIGKNELYQISMGRSPVGGRGLAKAGYILGILSIILGLFQFCLLSGMMAGH
jgi:serine/threonine-protein kinase